MDPRSTKKLQIRISEARLAVARRTAKLSGITLTQMILDFLAHARPGVLTEDEFSAFRAVTIQLVGACNNLNQLARAVNQRAARLPNTDTLDEIAALVADLRSLTDQIRTYLK